ncbi:MAG: porin family protein [Candidatus Binataceae bacterium]
MNGFLGTNRFTLVGGAATSFIYDHQSGINTFSLELEPILLWQINDWMLFEGSIQAALPAGTSASYQLPVASLQMFLNDYVELYLGIFDQPFGDFYEDQSPFWVNRFVTTPLPYGVNPLVPPTEVGAQLRGGFQWGKAGQIADYTIWSGNGPGYSMSGCGNNKPPSVHPTCGSTALVGDSLVGVNNIHLNSHMPAFGARFRVYPLPADSNLGRLELGASTYDGKWLNDFWYRSWGVDFNYLRGNLQARGEWLQSYREMPSGMGADNRQGWYVQAGYFLTGMRARAEVMQQMQPYWLHVPALPLAIDDFIDKLEPLVRYSGVNQRAVVQSEIITTPGIGFNGSPAAYAPHAREVALGLDYWFAPSIVWQNEFDLELPRAGGYYSDTGKPVGATPNDHAFLSQIAVGF